ncbi:GTP-binding protein [Geomonas sp. Red32]|uniref:sulfate adenylyltransferase subunit 1 n=1 Tax=Geomonas sp. Red32 TaxID=2912856 RepID=UPI00202CBD07|nr:GTP-binding protein [Geomonas sp. Red32]
MAESFSLVLTGHVDHGKSTLLGRLYADTGTLPTGHLEKVQAICQRQGKSFEYAFLFDAFLEEQEQGITIDVARAFFNWKGRRYLILDAPGHKEFIRNMVSGASRAEAAAIIVDAAEGVQEQSRRHAYLLKLLGIRQLLVVVNKMDLVRFSHEAFRAIERDFRAVLEPLGLVPRQFIPVCAREGDNVAAASLRLDWYQGPTLLGALEKLEKAPDRHDLPLRFPVQDVYKFDDRRIVAGRVESGELRLGDRLLFSPSGKTGRVKSIEAFNAATPPRSVPAGYSTGFTLEEQIFIERGEVATLADAAPAVTSLFRAVVFWMGNAPLEPAKRYLLRIGTLETEMEIDAVVAVIDSSTQLRSEKSRSVARNEVAEVAISTRRPVALDCYGDLEATGRFVIVDGYDICGAGVVTAPSPELAARRRAIDSRPAVARGAVALRERIRRNGHRPALVVLSAPPTRRLLRLARRLERRLFSAGRQVYLFNPRELVDGLAAGANFGHEVIEERAVAGMMRPLLDAGLVVIAVIAPPAIGWEPLRRELAPHLLVVLSPPFGEATTNSEAGDALNVDRGDSLELTIQLLMEQMESSDPFGLPQLWE